MSENNQAYRLEMLRKKHGLTTRSMGKELGVSNGIISRWCRGDAYPSRKHVKVICDYFNVNPEWLVFGIEYKAVENDLRFVYESLNDDNKDVVLKVANALLKGQVNNK